MVATYRRLSVDDDAESGASGLRSSPQNLKLAFPWILHSLLFGISVVTGALVALLLHLHDPFTISSNSQKGPPGLETNTAWGNIVQPNLLAVGKPTWVRSKPQYPDSSVEVPGPMEGKTESKYMATLEVTHQLNCLYNLYKLNYLNHFEDLQKNRENNLAHEQERIDHCIDILRQKLMCHHKCRDFEQIMSWAQERSYVYIQAIRKPTDVEGLQEYP
ncbi:hypothetical protein N8T08_008245 [Aspergillus melleus]|uniref:Uncharacterized protein n=1 Tax=Aspergillus melleus TaxID=138277 RepID=A0ACC3AWH7_9EURO|nr:hypothetical protein N8T08_008245 [Aspergillus melleus]